MRLIKKNIVKRRMRFIGITIGVQYKPPYLHIFAREGSAFQKIMHRIRLAAATDMSVMIFGEQRHGQGAYCPPVA